MEALPPANSVVDRCSSTNDLARRLGESGCPSGTWISARVQEKGRGRLGRSWLGAEGNLYLSVVLREIPKERWSWIPIAAGVAVARALERRFPELAVRIKWPNDLWVGGRKLGGILCEAAAAPGGGFVVAGIGLNCAASPADLEGLATSLADETGLAVNAEDVRAAIVGALVEEAAWLVRGPESARDGYDRRSALPPGTRVRWNDGDSPRSGYVEGLGSSGELRVSLENGDSAGIFAEDVSEFREDSTGAGGSRP